MVKFEMFNNVGEGITVDGVRTFLNANKNEEIQFDISTLGGDLVTGLTIHDLIKAHPKKTIANIVGLTASAGTVIAIGCDEVQISDNALFLIHNGWKNVEGNVYDFQKAASDLMKTDAIMVKMYREKTGLADIKIKELMKASDWLSPTEAIEYGFIDRVISSGIKIAASVMLSGAKGKINESLLIKLKEKMGIFGSKEKEILNVLALKDGNQMVIKAEEAAVGVEAAPLGAMSLEDGEYELADGRKIMIAGGTITEVIEKEEEAAAQASDDEMVNTVAEMLTASEAKIEAMIEAKLKPLQAMVSTHTPPKGKGPENVGNASMANPLQAKLEEKQAEIKANVKSKRKG